MGHWRLCSRRDPWETGSEATKVDGVTIIEDLVIGSGPDRWRVVCSVSRPCLTVCWVRAPHRQEGPREAQRVLMRELVLLGRNLDRRRTLILRGRSAAQASQSLHRRFSFPAHEPCLSPRRQSPSHPRRQSYGRRNSGRSSGCSLGIAGDDRGTRNRSRSRRAPAELQVRRAARKPFTRQMVKMTRPSGGMRKPQTRIGMKKKLDCGRPASACRS